MEPGAKLLTPEELAELLAIAEAYRGRFVSMAPRVQRVFQLLDKLLRDATPSKEIDPP